MCKGMVYIFLNVKIISRLNAFRYYCAGKHSVDDLMFFLEEYNEDVINKLSYTHIIAVHKICFYLFLF